MSHIGATRCALGLENVYLKLPRIIGIEKRRTVIIVGFEPATLETDPCPDEQGVGFSAWQGP